MNKLLILDDDPLIGKLIQLIGESIGMEVHYLPNPDMFMFEVNTWQPSHIMLDLVMPAIDGLEIMSKLAEQGCRASIIITSGVGTRVLDAAERSGRERGLSILGAMAKPFQPKQLREMLSMNPSDKFNFQSNVVDKVESFDITAESLTIGMAQNEFTVFYQPKINSRTGQLAGFEALARWKHPQYGWILPDRFISIAEDNNLIDELTASIFYQAIKWFALFCESVSFSGSLALNLSAITLKNPNFIEDMVSKCNQIGLPSTQITFELTESSAMDNSVDSLELLTRLRMKGFHLSIDDFGTGYSSMLQLVRLPFSEIKVDKSFVMTARTSEESRAVVKSIIELGHSLGLYATAEGVEDEWTLEYLKKLGCDFAQGYFIAKPLPAHEAQDWNT